LNIRLACSFTSMSPVCHRAIGCCVDAVLYICLSEMDSKLGDTQCDIMGTLAASLRHVRLSRRPYILGLKIPEFYSVWVLGYTWAFKRPNLMGFGVLTSFKLLE